MIRRKLSLSLILLLFVSSFTFAGANVTSPVTMLKGVADNLINKLEQNKSRLDRRHVIDTIVDQTILPYVATDIMAGSVVGRNYWTKASPEQRQKFIGEFKHLVISTYAAAFAAYNGDKIQFYPLRVNYKTARYLRVRSMIVRLNGQRISVNYNVFRQNGAWKIYDFSIEHVSMVGSYRSQFSGVLAQSGMSGLIAKLAKHNMVN
ncbi:MAG: ABC transporter substrate-binding protein [Gammaproteobacteria bacterium]|nr:ABC transporter substrate-binding protein [Gammaproteobacteria bacterium]